MTKKDYIALARAISSMTTMRERVTACAVVTQVLQRDNPAFDVVRFVQACGIDPSTLMADASREKKWVIRSANYWSNKDGWVDRASATVFSEKERDHIIMLGHMPIEGCTWEEA